MTPPELIGDLAAVFIARTWHNQGEPVKPEHDPQVLAARLHLRPHLIAILDTVDMPEPIRAAVADALLDAGEIYRDTRPDIATVDGQPAPVLVHSATLTIRHPYPGVGERVWPEPGDMVDGRVVLDADDDRFEDDPAEATR